MDMPEGAEGHSVASDGVGALIEGPKVAITQTRLYLDGAPGFSCPNRFYNFHNLSDYVSWGVRSGDSAQPSMKLCQV